MELDRRHAAPGPRGSRSMAAADDSTRWHGKTWAALTRAQ